ncbi:MAG: 23S rRNA (adenine(2503)-C(2))-methyltransferase RlmN [Synergistaceae bacterium]|nr:23S rRNA (adenine(2503)-C(2))-methyltransferase RlmN [Synergistaceae bacterium]
MGEKIYALDFNNEEWVKWLEEELQQPKFRADQICGWMWQRHVFDVGQMTDLSVRLRELLAQRVDFSVPVLVKEQRSNIDGTRKYLWQLRDGESVESVLLKQGDRLTACISTQVGCPLQCTFCATGLSGYVRSLSAGEIAGQFLAMEKEVERDINNVVYMGMGEPFLNTDNVLKSIRMLNSPKMRNLGIRHITISTSGVIPGIRELANSGLGVKLAVSLHAVNDELRSMLMPVNQTFPVDELRMAMQEYQKITGDRLTIEYVLFGGINDSVEHARELVRYLKGIHVFINLIPFNAVDGRYEKPKPENVLRFRTILETAGFESEIRQEQGSDIDAACGQLRRKTMTGEPCALEPKAYIGKQAVKKETDPAPARAHRSRAGIRGEPRPQEAGGAKRMSDATRSGSDPKEITKKPSGGFVEERGGRRAPVSRDKRGKTDRPAQERYRSGRMKEERPKYRGQGEGTELEAGGKTEHPRKEVKRSPSGYKPRDGKPEDGRGTRGERPAYKVHDKGAEPERSEYKIRDGKSASRHGEKKSDSRGKKASPKTRSGAKPSKGLRKAPVRGVSKTKRPPKKSL